jgi:hypothetical protein
VAGVGSAETIIAVAGTAVRGISYIHACRLILIDMI